MFKHCLGIRINDVFQERTCEYREKCSYYRDANLAEAFSRPDEFQELDTYNNDDCKYIDKEWLQKTETCETSDMLTDGLPIH